MPGSGESPAQAVALQLFADAMDDRVPLADPMACEARLGEVRGTRPNLNDAAEGRRMAVATLQHVARRLVAAGHAALDEIERAIIAGPDAHPDAFLRVTDGLSTALALVPPASSMPEGRSPSHEKVTA